jgi:hypothetical protein
MYVCNQFYWLKYTEGYFILGLDLSSDGEKKLLLESLILVDEVSQYTCLHTCTCGRTGQLSSSISTFSSGKNIEIALSQAYRVL